MTSPSRRPRVICHMMTSLDGRILTDGWPLSREGRRQYEEIHSQYDAQGWLCGRVTMEQHFAQGRRPDAEVAREHQGKPREDFIAPGDHSSFAFALDSHGKLAWSKNEIDGDHVVAILSERVSDEYLEFLRSRGVSYLITGSRDVDLRDALEKIAAKFGVRTLMLEGGGKINGSFLRAGLIDEVSVLVAPVADGRMGTPALFDVEGNDVAPRRLTLTEVEKRADGVLWLRYQADSASR
jgi:2,5-diamino-6-(ribosylamino)-4(3H)-pyrimidinone 5'-phosphate reductase